MTEALRLLSLGLFAVGPVVAVMALLRRAFEPSQMRSRIKSWRWYVPVVLLPAEWLLPPIVIALRIGEIEVGWLPVRVSGWQSVWRGPCCWPGLPSCWAGS